jgi:hypothetical protein
MKKAFTLLMAAMFATAVVSCNKDEKEDTDNKDNNTPVEAAANTAVIDGHTLHLDCRYSIESSGRGYLDGESVEVLDSVACLTVRGDVTQKNRTYDLSSHIADADYAFGFGVNLGDTTFNYFQQDNHVDGDPLFYGTINEQEYPNGAFQSGTLTVNCTSELLTYKILGVLRNGKAVSIHISIPASEWETLPW